MNNLKWIITELVDSVTKYVEANDDFRKIRDSKKNEQSVKADNAADQTQTTVTSTIAAAASFLTGNPSPETTDLAIQNPPPAPTLFSQVAYAAGSVFSASHFNLKAEKTSAANEFIGSVEAIRDQLKGVYDPNTVKQKLDELCRLVDAEIQMVGIMRQDHDKMKGEYDALLSVFKSVLEWLRLPDNINLLCISLKADEVNESLTMPVINTGNPSNATNTLTVIVPGRNKTRTMYLPLIPQAKELTSFLMRKILEIQLDKARAAEAILLKYKPVVLEAAYDDLMDYLPRSIHNINFFNELLIEAFNVNPTILENSKRLENICGIAGNLCFEAMRTKNKHDSMFSLSSNQFLVNLIDDLTSIKVKADKKFHERKQQTLSTVIAAPRADSVPSSPKV